MQARIKPPCRVCALIRRFLFGIALLGFLAWTNPDWTLPEGYDYSTIVGDLFLVVFLAVLAWKFYLYRRSARRDPN
jgi:hypothetical protein